MRTLYRRWIENWENRLCSRATNRVVRPFEWGVEWTHSWACAQRAPQNGHAPHAYLKLLNQKVVESSAEFFGYPAISSFNLREGLLQFDSPVKTPHPEN